MKLLRITTHDISLNGLLKGQLAFLRRNGIEVVGVAADTGKLQLVEEREGIRVVNLPMHREISLRTDIRSLWQMYRLMRREKPEIVHANTPKGSLLGMMAAWMARVPVRIYTVTGLRFETAGGNLRRILKLMERITCRCATEVIPEGDGVARTLRREKITRRPLRKIHNGNINGVDTEHFDPAKVEPEPSLNNPELTTFVFVGRMVRDKGINELVAAFQRLHCERPDTRLLLVGRFEDKLDPVLPRTKEIIEANEAIVCAGYQSDIRPFLRASSVLVLPSYREGFPNVVLQAGAMSLPVIVADVNGADEVITPGENGLIIPRRDETALYGAMKQMAENPEMRCQMARHARRVITERFEQKDVWAGTLARYRELTSKGK